MGYFNNRSQRRKFNKLRQEEKLKVSEIAINQTFGKVLAGRVSSAMIDGMDLQCSHFYKTYVSKIDSGELSEGEKQDCIDNLFSAIRTGHLNYVKNHGQREQEDGHEKNNGREKEEEKEE